MKIVLIVRTRNEERNIATFCQCYSMADVIVVADGGSTDNTVKIAKTFPNVIVYEYKQIVSQDDGKTWRNPHGHHINFMIDKAVENGADWIIFDDCDCFPNVYLQHDLREVLESTEESVLFLNRVYMYGNNQYLKDATLPGGKRATWTTSTSLYAWKPGSVTASILDPWVHEMNINAKAVRHLVAPPYCVLHDFYPTDGSRLEKVKFYDLSGEQPNCNDPLRVYNDIQEVEEWMRWR